MTAGRGRRWLTAVAVVLFFGKLVGAEVEPGTLEVAQVLAVNPQLQVVVLNVGREAGTRVGMPFLILRGDRLIGRVRVVEVRRRVCGAVIEQVEKGVTPAAGDAARVARS